MIETDRSRRVLELECKRAFWHAYRSLGKGLSPAKQGPHLLVGQAMHLGVQGLALGQGWLRVREEIFKLLEGSALDQEQRDLALALPLLWRKERLSAFQAEYEVLAIEPELRVDLASAAGLNGEAVVLMTRPDGILRRREDGALLQWELKSAATLWSNTVQKWTRSLQLMAQQLALKEWALANGMAEAPIGGAQVEYLLKGARKADKAGIKTHSTPLVWAYYRDSAWKKGGVPTGGMECSIGWKKDYEKRLVGRYTSLEEWIEQLPREETAPLAVQLQVANPSEWEIQQAAVQWTYAARAEAASFYDFTYSEEDSQDEVLDALYPMNTEHCYRMGPCAFLPLCTNLSAARDPLGSGFAIRTANHPESEE